MLQFKTGWLPAVLLVSILLLGGSCKEVNDMALNDFEIIEQRFYDFLTGGPSLNLRDSQVITRLEELTGTATEYWQSMEKSHDRTSIWSDLSLSFYAGEQFRRVEAPYEMTNTYLRLGVLSRAYKTRGTGVYLNQELGSDIVNALIWMSDNIYYEKEASGNWWDWEIGTPLRLIDCLVLMRDQLPGEVFDKDLAAIFHHVHARPARVGDANSMWNLFIRLMRGALSRNAEYLDEVVGEINNWFRETDSGDGFHPDGSYLMHRSFPYTGSYGASAIECFTKSLYLLHGTSYNVDETSIYHAIKWVNEAYSPFMYNGLMMDMVRGRSMSRETEGDHMIGHVILRSMYLLALIIDDAAALPILRRIKHWMENATHRSVYEGRDVINNNNYVFFVNGLRNLENNNRITAVDKPVFHRQFYAMARTVHARPHYTFGISQRSDTISNFEIVNGENLRGWNMSEGMTYLYNGDLGQYSDSYWPTVDPFRLPGTTVVNGLPSSIGVNQHTFAGGVDIGGFFGISGMYLMPHDKELSARKSWFMFHNEIVAMGSAINSTEANPIETIIENRRLRADNSNVFTVDANVIADPALQTVLHNPVWMHKSGNTQGSDIGYFFPIPYDVQLIREERSDTWLSVNINALSSIVPGRVFTDNYLTLYFDHGRNPVNGSYCYVLLPGMNAQQVRGYSENPDIVILENSEYAHGVYHNSLRITGVNFWSDEVRKTGPVTSNTMASIAVMETDDVIFVAISDPANRDGVITVELDFAAAAVQSHDSNIAVSLMPESIVLTVATAGKNRQPSYAVLSK